MGSFRVCVTGGRDYSDAATVAAAMRMWWPFLLGEGGARGADALCADWVRSLDPRGVSTYPAAWAIQGKAAGMIRNRRMLDDFQPHLLIAFPGGVGTAGCVAEAHKRGIPVWHV